MKIMADEIASGNKNGLNIFNTVFKRDLKVSEGFNGRWIDLFEVARTTHNGSGGSHRANKMRHRLTGLLPDFWASSLYMSLLIGNIIKLIGPDGAMGFDLVQALCQAP